MPDVTPFFKEPKPEKPERTPMQKMGARNRNSGMRHQRNVRKEIEKMTGTIAARFVGQLGNEEAWHGLPWRIEVKSGNQSLPAVTAYEKMRAQSEANHAQGDPRPFVGVVKVNNVEAVVLVRLKDLATLLETLP